MKNELFVGKFVASPENVLFILPVYPSPRSPSANQKETKFEPSGSDKNKLTTKAENKINPLVIKRVKTIHFLTRKIHPRKTNPSHPIGMERPKSKQHLHHFKKQQEICKLLGVRI